MDMHSPHSITGSRAERPWSFELRIEKNLVAHTFRGVKSNLADKINLYYFVKGKSLLLQFSSFRSSPATAVMV